MAFAPVRTPPQGLGMLLWLTALGLLGCGGVQVPAETARERTTSGLTWPSADDETLLVEVPGAGPVDGGIDDRGSDGDGESDPSDEPGMGRRTSDDDNDDDNDDEDALVDWGEDEPRTRPFAWPTPGPAGEGMFEGPDPYQVHVLRPGLVLPYPLTNVIQQVGGCRRGRRMHVAIDIGGVGPYMGLGTPVRSMVRARIAHIGRPEEDPGEFGWPDQREGEALRKNKPLPRSLDVPGYGTVFFFTRNYGRWKSGTILDTLVLDGPLRDHNIRYMHLGAIHPSLKVGDIVEAGQEIGLMGCTAIQRDMPHVHIDIYRPNKGRRIDPSVVLGLPSRSLGCPRWRPRPKSRRTTRKPGASQGPRRPRKKRPRQSRGRTGR